MMDFSFVRIHEDVPFLGRPLSAGATLVVYHRRAADTVGPGGDCRINLVRLCESAEEIYLLEDGGVTRTRIWPPVEVTR